LPTGSGGGRETQAMKQKRRPQKTTELTLEIEQAGLRDHLRGADQRTASLTVIAGIDIGHVFDLDVDCLVLGRDPSCGGVIRDDGISRRHAEVRREASDRFVIRDLDSTNGVFVRGERVVEHVLRDGDKVLLGRRTILKFGLQDAIDIRFQRQMYESSVRDGLTGAFNRKHFDERMRSELSFAERHEGVLTVAMFDLDHFKEINDRFGHQAGDQVLKQVARSIADTIRTEDIFARYGGEEFVVIARGINEIGGLALGERIRRVVEDLRVQDQQGKRIPVTISVGVATVPGGIPVSAAAVIAHADRNLYAAKEQGRNRVVASLMS
jgi:diguanylate cyclase (GGDEF)-like protein